MMVLPRYEGPPLISIDGVPNDQLAPVSRQRRRLEAMLAELSSEDWGGPSRCEDWTVQDVVAHIVGVNAFWHASLLAGLDGTPTRVLVGFDPKTTPALMVAGMRNLSPGEVLDQFVVSNDALLDVMGQIDDDGWGALAEAPPGHLPIRVVAHHALWDCWVHERDIALPLGLTVTTEPDEVGSSLRYVCALSAVLAIAYGDHVTGVLAARVTEPDLNFVLEAGECVTVRDEMPPPEAPCLRGEGALLVDALSLRSPLPASIPIEWREVLGGLATAFTTGPP
jgi:uncharacterized protein (TIGR03083 family)